jgi:hypothetical protein
MADLSMSTMWLDYFGVGGTLSPSDLELALMGSVDLSIYDHDLLALVLNEHFVDREMGRPLDYWGSPAF